MPVMFYIIRLAAIRTCSQGASIAPSLSHFCCTCFFGLSVSLSVCEGKSVPFQSLAGLAVDEESCIVGTLFKRMDLKPSILKAITQEVG